MKTVVCITAFDNYNYDVRMKYMERILETKYNVIILASNFDHRKKELYITKRKNLKLIDVVKYSKNLSIKRLYSHYKFSKQCFKEINHIKPELIIISGPPNFLFFFGKKYKKQNSNCKIIADIIDMWPESIPLKPIFKKMLFLPFEFWKYIRNTSLKQFNYIIFECNLYKKILYKYVKLIPNDVLYLTKEINSNKVENNYSIKEINFLYLGSINNIIDIDLIVKFLGNFSSNKAINLHVIGIGEQKNELLKKVKNVCKNVYDYGIVLDEKSKNLIAKKCNYGLNIMKNTVCVGLTMKSIDYFRLGLPIINSISNDTGELINDYRCGFDLNYKNINDVVDRIEKLSSNDYFALRKNALNLFNKTLSSKHFNNAFNNIINDLK